MPRFRNRTHAGQVLAEKLAPYAGRDDVVVLGLPRGGVPVAYEVAKALDVPLDAFIVRKLGVPGQEELAMGAIAGGGVRVLNQEVVRLVGISPSQIEAVEERERRELARREHLYRMDRPQPDLNHRVVILIDDGLATGATMRAAVAASRQSNPSKIVVAVPVAPPETCEELAAEADEVICALTPVPFYGVGLWYDQFDQTGDQEVRDLLERAAHQRPHPPDRRGATQT